MKISPDLHILKQLILLQDMAQASAYTSFMSGKDYPQLKIHPIIQIHTVNFVGQMSNLHFTKIYNYRV